MDKTKIIKKTPLEYNHRLSEKYSCNVYLKREDLQNTRSFKIRGAFNKICKLYPSFPEMVVTCSAGNHAQGIAYICNKLGIVCTIFVPECTPLQKRQRITEIGETCLNLKIIGKNFDECLTETFNFLDSFTDKKNILFIHPFDDFDVIEGQGTIMDEIISEISEKDDFTIICPVGGGGLISGQLLKNKRNFKIIGVESENSNALSLSLKNNEIYVLDTVDTFVDGTAVRKIGTECFKICKNNYLDIVEVSNNELCSHIIDLYQYDGIITEPAGALSIAGLNALSLKKSILNKNIVCIISGGNNDIMRYGEFIERSLIFKSLKHYFIITFNQSPGTLEKFITNVLSGTYINISRFEYIKKTNKSEGSVFVGFELPFKECFDVLIKKLKENNFNYTYLKTGDPIFDFFVV